MQQVSVLAPGLAHARLVLERRVTATCISLHQARPKYTSLPHLHDQLHGHVIGGVLQGDHLRRACPGEGVDAMLCMTVGAATEEGQHLRGRHAVTQT
jgi:hypothetical protein